MIVRCVRRCHACVKDVRDDAVDADDDDMLTSSKNHYATIQPTMFARKGIAVVNVLHLNRPVLVILEQWLIDLRRKVLVEQPCSLVRGLKDMLELQFHYSLAFPRVQATLASLITLKKRTCYLGTLATPALLHIQTQSV